jgi:hypothetical protein
MPSDIQSREAAHGSKMIELKVRFWTDDLADGKQIRPKHAWTSGVVRLVANSAHGIKGGRPKPFNSLLDLTAVIEQALVDEGIQLHISRRMRKFISAPDDRASRKATT